MNAEDELPTIAELGCAYRRGDLRPGEVLDLILHRAESTDNPIFTEVLAEEARRDARDADRRLRLGHANGPLDGVPIAVKANIAIRGYRWSAGMACRRMQATEDAHVIHRLREAGAIVVGTTNMAEAAVGAVTANPWFGTVADPRRPHHHAGGSSGGSAAAVRAGLAAGALGTDTIGSIRIPAAYCGIAALKPTIGRLSCTGVVPLAARLDVVGPMAKTVEDLLLLDSALGNESPSTEMLDTQMPRSVLMAMPDSLPAGAAREWERLRDALHAEGVPVRMCSVEDLGRSDVRLACLLEVSVSAYLEFRALLDDSESLVSDALRNLLVAGAHLPSWRLRAAEQVIQETSDRIAGLLGEDSILAMPVTEIASPRLDESPSSEVANWTAIASAAGNPAVTLPSFGDHGVQLVGPLGADRWLLRVGRRLEHLLRGEGEITSGRAG